MEVLNAKVTEGGRIVIPAAMRKLLRVEVGGTVQLIADEDGVRISTPAIALRRLQEKFKAGIQPGRSLVDELIADRRAEVAREEAADG